MVVVYCLVYSREKFWFENVILNVYSNCQLLLSMIAGLGEVEMNHSSLIVEHNDFYSPNKYV